MTVQELIAKLSEHPPDMEIVINGYEGGYTKVGCVESLKITASPVNNAWYYGSYKEDENGVEVVYLPR